jgi:hypothetical protein
MKILTASLIAAVSVIAISQPAFAQRSSREKAINQCVVAAQKAVPTVEDSTDASTTARVNIYKSCMRKLGLRP